MDRIFDLYLANADRPDSEAYAELSLPATPYEMLDVLDKLRLAEGERMYWELTWYHAFDELSSLLDKNCEPGELNTLAWKLGELDDLQRTAFAGLLKMEQAKGGPISISRMIDLARGTGCCHVLDEALNDSQLGRTYAEKGLVPGLDKLPDSVFDMLDFEKIGRDLRLGEGGVFVDRTMDHPGGYVVRHSELAETYEEVDRQPKAMDYTILLRVSKGFFNDPAHDSNKTVHLKLPATSETLDAVLTTLDVWDWREAGWSCLDCKVPSLTEMLSDMEENINAVNDMAQRLADMEPEALNVYKALLSAVEVKSLQQAEQLMDTLDQYILSPQYSSPIDAAKGELSAILTETEAKMIVPHLNLYQYGQELIQKRGGILTGYGLIERKDHTPVQTAEEQPHPGGMEMV